MDTQARLPNVVRRYWQGGYAPALSVWLVLIGGRLLVLALYRSLPPDLPVWLRLMLGLADLAFLLWQVTGALRAIRNELEG
ncbi:MAG: hypothetical protein WBA91_04440, partial [Paracoccaceae bacterium]